MSAPVFTSDEAEVDKQSTGFLEIRGYQVGILLPEDFWVGVRVLRSGVSSVVLAEILTVFGLDV